MNKWIFVLFLLAFTLPAHAAQIVRGPYLEDPTQNSLILRFQTDRETPSWVEYGPAGRCNQIMTLTPSATQHKIVLHGLVPNQEFCFRVYIENNTQDGTQAPAEGKFSTLYTPERKLVHFVALGNTGAAPPPTLPDGTPMADEAATVKAQLAARIGQEKSDFLIHTGNLTHSGLNQDADSEFFHPFAAVLAQNPLFVALGANEYGPERASRDSKSFLRSNYARFHDMSWSDATPKYYFFDTANARFIFLDANAANGAVWAPDMEEKSAQTKWLKTTLSSAAEKWKIVIVGTPLYSTAPGGSNSAVQEAWGKIFDNYRVDLVLQGGGAAYERTFPLLRGQPDARGVTYVTLGAAGLTPQKRSGSDGFTARYVAAPHYAVGQVVDRKLTLKVYSETGKLLDTLDLYL